MQYVALYAGPDHKSARLVCAVADPKIILSVAEAGLRNLPRSPDPVLARLAEGNREALAEVVRMSKAARGGKK